MSYNNKFLSSVGSSQTLTDGTADIYVNTVRTNNLLDNYLVSSDVNGELITNSSGNVSVGYNVGNVERLSSNKLSLGTNGDTNSSINITDGETIIRTTSTTTSGDFCNGLKIVADPIRSKGIQIVDNTDNNKIWLLGNKYNSSLNNFNILYTPLGPGTNTANFLEYFTILPNGNVGVGRTNPTAKFEVNGAINTLSTYNMNGAVVLSPVAMNLGTTTSVINTSGRLGLSTNSTERLSITTAGSVGIGITNPAYTLDILGDCQISGNLILNGTLGSKQSYIQIKAQTTQLINNTIFTYVNFPTVQVNYGGIYTMVNTNSRVQISQGGLYRVSYSIYAQNVSGSAMGDYSMFSAITLTDSGDAQYTTNYFGAMTQVGGFLTNTNYYYLTGTADVNVIANDKIGILMTQTSAFFVTIGGVNKLANKMTITRIGENYGNIN